MFTALKHSLSGDLAQKDGTDVGKDNVEKKPCPKTTLSAPTLSYTVQPNDTLTSIAARFDTTPSELTKMNRLATRYLFSGQVLMVPDKGGTKENITNESCETEVIKEKQETNSTLGENINDFYRSGLKFPKTPVNSVDERSLDKECLEKFLKIKVRHVTDGQGVVAGVLLVTPNAVMFDPNVSDPLVIERGSESYGVIAPMEFVVNAALFTDIAHMKVKDTDIPRPEIPKPEIYYGRSQSDSAQTPDSQDLLQVGDAECGQESPSKDISIGKDATLEFQGGSQDNDNDSSCSCGGDTRDSSAFPKAFEHEILTPASSETSPTDPPSHQPVSHQSSGLGDLTPIAEAPRPEDVEEKVKDLADNCEASSTPPTTRTPNDKKRTTSVTFSTSSESDMPTVPEDSSDLTSHESRKQKVLKRLSYPLSWMDSLTAEKEAGNHQAVPSSAPPAGPNNSVPTEEQKQPGMFSNVFSMSNVSNMLTRRPSLDFVKKAQSNEQTANPQAQKRAQFKEGPKFGLKSMVSIDDMPDLFASFDKLIPKPSSACDDPPLYLCLRMGKPVDKPIPKTTPIMTYGKKLMRPEYWFSIPRNRTDELYNFFQVWASDIYGEADEEAIRAKGFILLDEELRICSGESFGLEGEESELSGELKEMTKESWEKLKAPYVMLYSLMKNQMTISTENESLEHASMSEELRRALYSSSSLTSLDLEAFLPELLGSSEIIDDAFKKSMYRNMPARVQGYNWRLIFSTSEHGFSLKSLYRKMADYDSPIIMCIQDTNQNKFGVFLSCPLRVSESFYGTGETFLFVCNPEFKTFPWTGENNFFVKGNNESLYIGGGDGNFGICLDGDLYKGVTQACKTFGNPPLTQGQEDFLIKIIECWVFE